MNFSFAIYETLRRLLLLGAGVAVLGVMFAPDDDVPQIAEATPVPAETAVDVNVNANLDEPVPQKTLI